MASTEASTDASLHASPEVSSNTSPDTSTSPVNVLIIGGCGGLGYHITQQCLTTGFNPTVLDLHSTRNLVSGVRYIPGDLTSPSEVLSALHSTRATVLINTASPRMVRAEIPSDKPLYHKVNIEGTRNLLQCAQQCGTVKAFIYTSSSSIVHNQYTDLINATEEVPYCFLPEQQEYYSHTKAVAEKMVLEFNDVSGVLTAALRAATMIGEGDTLATRSMGDGAKGGKLKYQIGDGTNLFDFTYTGNTAYAHILTVKALLRESEDLEAVPKDLKVNGESFFITNDDPRPFWDIPRAIGDAAGYATKKEDIWIVPAKLYFVVARFVEGMFWVGTFGTKRSAIESKSLRYLSMTRTFDISKAKARLGYEPVVGLDEGLERAGRWYRETYG